MDFKTRPCVTNLSKARMVMKSIIEEAVESGLSLSVKAVQEKSVSETDELFREAWPRLCCKLLNLDSQEALMRKRVGDVTYITVYGWMKRAGAAADNDGQQNS